MIAEAFAEAMEAIVRLYNQPPPLPKGLTVVENDDWTLAVNNGREPLPWEGSEVPGYNVGAIHKHFLAMSLVGPDGGCVGGMTEDRFIEEMKAIAA